MEYVLQRSFSGSGEGKDVMCVPCSSSTNFPAIRGKLNSVD